MGGAQLFGVRHLENLENDVAGGSWLCQKTSGSL